MKKFTIIIAAFIFSISFSMGQQFVEYEIEMPGLSDSYADWGDFDNDGDHDLLLCGMDYDGEAMTDIFINEEGDFYPLDGPFPGIQKGMASFFDYDNDCDLDVIITGESTHQAAFIFKNEEGSFTDIGFQSAGFNDYSRAAWGDYDNDGDLDVIISGNWNTKLYMNEGEDQFTEVTTSIIPLASPRLAFVDYDNDQDLDLFICGDSGGGMISRLYENDQGDFIETNAEFTGLSAGSVDWGDYDNDGDQDLLLTGFDDYMDHYSLLYKNNGNDDFDIVYAGLPPITLGSARFGDYDNDGMLDIAIAGKLAGCGAFTAAVYHNIGNDIFTDINAGLDDIERGVVTWGDFDNDSDLDIMLTGMHGSQPVSKIYQNEVNAPNIAPNAPDGLSASLDSETVTLLWNPASDLTTPQAALTYNIMVGTTPQGMDVVSPVADRNNGQRFITDFGNTGNTTSWKLQNLKPGTYYWRVQTIDHGFTGSTFSDESTFEIIAIGNEELAASQVSITVAGKVVKVDVPVEVLPASAEIIDLSGSVVINKPLKAGSNHFNLSGLTSIIYLIRVDYTAGTLSEKIIIR